MKWLKRWIREAVMEPAPPGEEQYPSRLYDKKTGARNTPAEEMLAQMASSVAVVFRIDNGFMVGINMIDHTHIGQRGKLLYAKDAQEVAERMIAHETAFKIGVRSGGISGEVQLDKYPPNTWPAPQAAKQAYKPMLEYPTPKKGINYV